MTANTKQFEDINELLRFVQEKIAILRGETLFLRVYLLHTLATLLRSGGDPASNLFSLGIVGERDIRSSMSDLPFDADSLNTIAFERAIEMHEDAIKQLSKALEVEPWENA